MNMLIQHGGMHDPHQNNRPKASINWILPDEQFNVAHEGSGSELVGETDVYTLHTFLNQPIVKSGYLYVWVSNETTNINVFFDNLTIVHRAGPLLQEEDYYPFGLTMSGISSKAATTSPANKLKYNGKEEQRQEFSDGSGLEWLDYGARMYDNQIGRFFTQDRFAELSYDFAPYRCCASNPIKHLDINGYIYLLR